MVNPFYGGRFVLTVALSISTQLGRKALTWACLKSKIGVCVLSSGDEVGELGELAR